tara:strand:+ start:665 stop:1105 length:441 start_codon:yes stop_codon:yes gene_type:complete
MNHIVNKVKNKNTHVIDDETIETKKVSNYTNDKINYLINLKNKIENLDEKLHVKILKVLADNNVTYSENKNGVFVNLNKLDENILSTIEGLLEYLDIQETNINKIENIKDEINSDFFKYKKDIKKDNKKNSTMLNNNTQKNVHTIE